MRKTRKSGDPPTCYDIVMPKIKLAKNGTLLVEKKNDLKSMLKFMPLQDQEYYIKSLGCRKKLCIRLSRYIMLI